MGRGEFGVIQAAGQVEALDFVGPVSEQLRRRIRFLNHVVQRHPHCDDAGGAGLNRLHRQRFCELGRSIHRSVRRSEDDDGALCGGCGHFSGIGNLLRGRAETTREFLSVLLRGTVNGGEVGTFILSIRIALAGLESARIEDTRQVFGDPDAAQTPSHTA